MRRTAQTLIVGLTLGMAGGCADMPAWSTSNAKISRPTSASPVKTYQAQAQPTGVPVTIERTTQPSTQSKPRPEVDRSAMASSQPAQQLPMDSQGNVSFNNEPTNRAPMSGNSGSSPTIMPVKAGPTSSAGFKAFGELDTGRGRNAGQLDEGVNISQITDIAEGACFDPAIDRSGTKIVFASTMHRPTADLYMKSVDGKTITQLTADPADDVMPAITPDGTRIAFTSNRAGNWDIYTMSIGGGQVTQVTSDSDAELHPSWSPDGRYIAYCKLGSQSQRWEIWIVDINNLSAPRFLEYGLFPKWSPDPARSKLLFQRPRQRGSRYHSIWTVDIVGNEAMHPTEIVSAANAAAINPTWSPDGSRIAFVTIVSPEDNVEDQIQQSDIWVVNLDGTERTNLTNGQFANFQPTWAPDGRVYFVSNRSGTDNIWMVGATNSMSAQSSPATIVNAPTDSNNVDE